MKTRMKVGDLVTVRGKYDIGTEPDVIRIDGWVKDYRGRLFAAVSRVSDGKGLGTYLAGSLQYAREGK